MLERALEILGDGPSPLGLTRGRIMLTLAYIRAELGHVCEGLRTLDELAAGGDPALAGLIAGQRGLMLLRAGRSEEAVEPIDAALRLLGRDTPERAQMLLNRGVLRTQRGELEAARRDVLECMQAAERIGLGFLAGQARHNLGRLWHVSGDLPRALQAMDGAAEALYESWPDLEYVYRVDRARVLFAAGLLAEADEELVLAARLIGRGGRRQDRGEVELSRAQVALAAGRPGCASALARRAARRFAERGSQSWIRLAELAQAQASLAMERPGRVDPDALGAMAGDLARLGLRDDARLAGITRVRACLRIGDLDQAGRLAADALRLGRRDPIGTRLALRAVRAGLAEAGEDGRTADAERRTGLRELQRYQATFGSLDLQTAVSVHGRELAEAGLAAALRSGGPGDVLAWAERGRALASRLSPVRPPEDAEAAETLARLRLIRRDLRSAELAGHDDPALRRRGAELERRVRHRSWYLPGAGDVERPVTLSGVQDALDASNVLVAHVVVRGAMHALAVGPRRAAVLPLGAAAPLMERLRRVRSDLDMLASTGYPDSFRSTIRASLTAGLAALDGILWRPLAAAVPREGAVALVPAGALAAVPWTMLPSLTGRPTTVARSATSWLAQRTGRSRSAPTRAGDGDPAVRVIALSGPDLPHADAEARAVAQLWPDGLSLLGSQATGTALLDALSSVDIVHVAAHGRHEAANPLFSSVQLTDGPVFGYDLSGRRQMPWHVMLSACDLGLATERPGDELLGMTAALLQAGAGSVMASVARVSDATAREVAMDYHAGLRAGRAPSEALAEVTAAAASPFVCFGSGW